MTTPTPGVGYSPFVRISTYYRFDSRAVTAWPMGTSNPWAGVDPYNETAVGLFQDGTDLPSAAARGRYGPLAPLLGHSSILTAWGKPGSPSPANEQKFLVVNALTWAYLNGYLLVLGNGTPAAWAGRPTTLEVYDFIAAFPSDPIAQRIWQGYQQASAPPPSAPAPAPQPPAPTPVPVPAPLPPQPLPGHPILSSPEVRVEELRSLLLAPAVLAAFPAWLTAPLFDPVWSALRVFAVAALKLYRRLVTP